MKKGIFFTAMVLFITGGLLISLTPDPLSLIIVGIMSAVAFMGYILSLLPGLLYMGSFKGARKRIEESMEVQSTESWLAVFKMDGLFHNKFLDRVFNEYKNKVTYQKENEEIATDVEDFISEDLLALHTWQGVVHQIPGTLTGLGIIGTFIGLITGISNIGFTSVAAALESIEVLLGGIRVAFYTSIAGVIFSIMFNVLGRMIWNAMLREYGMFVETFHRLVIPYAQEMERLANQKNMKRVLDRLDRIPKNTGFSMASYSGSISVTNEQILMDQVRSGMKNDEFTYYIQPRHDLNTKHMVAAEALVRWNHPTLGLLPPSTFVPVLEKNGFITKMDAYIWENVCKKIRLWIDQGHRPVPISINLSRTDIMAMDVIDFFEHMLEKYHIPPRSLEIEISINAYLQNPNTTEDVAGALRQMGFRIIMDGFDGDFIAIQMLDGIEADALKLDLRFIPTIDQENRIEAIFDQGRKLGIEILAEGIENSEQVTTLKNCGCSSGQGYYFNKPMSVEAYEEEVR